MEQGIIQAHRDEEMRWRVSKKSVLDYIKKSQTEDGFLYVADEEHYTEVFRRMTEVKRSLKIATGDLKNFNVTIERDGSEEKIRLCNFFLSLVERGVLVQVVCMKPFARRRKETLAKARICAVSTLHRKMTWMTTG